MLFPIVLNWYTPIIGYVILFSVISWDFCTLSILLHSHKNLAIQQSCPFLGWEMPCWFAEKNPVHCLQEKLLLFVKGNLHFFNRDFLGQYLHAYGPVQSKGDLSVTRRSIPCRCSPRISLFKEYIKSHSLGWDVSDQVCRQPNKPGVLVELSGLYTPGLGHLLGMYITKALPRFSTYAIIPNGTNSPRLPLLDR